MRLRKSLTSVVLVALTGLAQPVLAEHAEHDHQHSGNADLKLTLDSGKKWMTDAPLRLAMGNIQAAMTTSHKEIHEKTLPDVGYAALADAIQTEVGNMVKQCKLKPEADAQLHLIIADLLQGAEAMSGKLAATSRRQGAIKVMGALKNYVAFFEDGNPRSALAH